MSRNVVITSEGIVSAIGLDKQQTLQSLRAGKSGIGEMHYLASSHHELPVGEVKLSDEEMKCQLGISCQAAGDHANAMEESISRTTLLGIMAVQQALEDANLSPSTKRIVLISGTTVGGMDLTERHFHEMITRGEKIELLLQHEGGSCTERIARHFGIFTECTTISTACSSAANALILGANLLKSGQADIVVAGGTEALTRFHLNGFNSLMILDHEPCRPFDAHRAGLNLGEGAAYVVMETEESARQRGAAVHGWLTGYGNACDAFHQTASSDDGEGAFLAMSQALTMAGLQPSDIDYVNAHGTGTPNNDVSESVALQRLFADKLPPVSSTKSLTGHTTSASGSIETVICLLAMQHGFIPANVHWQTPMADGIVPSMGEKDCVLRHVMCNSFGFGGNDSSLVLSRGKRQEARGKRQEARGKKQEEFATPHSDFSQRRSKKQEARGKISLFFSNPRGGAGGNHQRGAVGGSPQLRKTTRSPQNGKDYEEFFALLVAGFRTGRHRRARRHHHRHSLGVPGE